MIGDRSVLGPPPPRGRIAVPTSKLFEAAVQRVEENPGSLLVPETGCHRWPKVRSVTGCLWLNNGRYSKEGQS